MVIASIATVPLVSIRSALNQRHCSWVKKLVKQVARSKGPIDEGKHGACDESGGLSRVWFAGCS
jgi:hypothetical protein